MSKHTEGKRFYEANKTWLAASIAAAGIFAVTASGQQPVSAATSEPGTTAKAKLAELAGAQTKLSTAKVTTGEETPTDPHAGQFANPAKNDPADPDPSEPGTDPHAGQFANPAKGDDDPDTPAPSDPDPADDDSQPAPTTEHKHAITNFDEYAAHELGITVEAYKAEKD